MRPLHVLAGFVVGGLALLAAVEPDLFALLSPVACAGVTWLVAAVLIHRYCGRTWLTFPMGYLILMGLFHLGLVIPVALGAEPGPYTDWLDSPSLDKALWLCTAAFAFYAAGAVVGGSAARSERPPLKGNKNLLAVGVLLSGVGFALLWVAFIRLGLATASYSESYSIRTETDPRQFGLGFMLALMGLPISAAGAGERQMRWVALGFGVMFLPLFLYGFRGQFLVYMFALMCAWNRKSPTNARKLASIGLVVLMIVVPIVKVLRNAAMKSIGDALNEASTLDFFKESGGSLYPLVATLDAIDGDREPHWYGHSYVQAAARLIPNVAGEWSGQAEEDLPPNSWISQREVPWVYERGGGIGFSAVAEPYLNAGPLGVLFWFLGLGFLLARWESHPDVRTYRYAAILTAYAPLLWTVRNDTTNFARPAVWGSLVVGAAWLASRQLRGRARRKEALG